MFLFIDIEISNREIYLSLFFLIDDDDDDDDVVTFEVFFRGSANAHAT